LAKRKGSVGRHASPAYSGTGSDGGAAAPIPEVATMRRWKAWVQRSVLTLALLAGGAAVLGTAGCEVTNDEFYNKNTEWAPGREPNPYRKFAFAYIALVLLGTFFMWTVCKSSRRSVVKAGDEH
jgi:hypothetical protein